ncbi:hypothetical protein EDC55_11444 [Allofrancisella inopinata]|nr:hypothetical protein EDC55_11444 [Allofrancisella inopinata]
MAHRHLNLSGRYCIQNPHSNPKCDTYLISFSLIIFSCYNIMVKFIYLFYKTFKGLFWI